MTFSVQFAVIKSQTKPTREINSRMLYKIVPRDSQVKHHQQNQNPVSNYLEIEIKTSISFGAFVP